MEKFKTINENKFLLNPIDELKLNEIIKKMERLQKKGCNDEKLNEQYRNLLKLKFKENA
jgi:hypothetical protein